MSDYAFLNEKGKLLTRIKPVVYLDTSVLVEYWTVEGLEYDRNNDAHTKSREPQYYQTIRKLFKSGKDIDTLIQIRRKINLGQPRIIPVTSALAIFELAEWHAEATIRQMLSEVVGAKTIAKRNKKDIGKILKSTIEEQEQEIKEGKKTGESTGIEMVMGETLINPSFAVAHGLQGILVVNIVNLSLLDEDAWGPCSELAYLQIGGADIVHLLFAHHLGCEYFTSFDEDYKRVRELLSNEFNLKLLSSPQELLTAL